MSDNGAMLQGYTKEVLAGSGFTDMHLLVRPDADLSGTFKAWSTDQQEWIRVHGCYFKIKDIKACVNLKT